MSNPLNSTDARKETQKLRTAIEQHNRLYYVDAAPEISDREFDLMLRRLTDLEKQFPELADPNSPTQRVGGEPIKGFKNAAHAVPMMSLGNQFTEKEVLEYATKHGGPFILEPKIDGISISVRYENGTFVQALTRGDGERGDDVSANLKTIPSFPLRLNTENPPAIFEVRGEVYMTRSGFAALNEQRQDAGLDAFANPRNACAGSMKLLDPREVAKRPLDIVFYATGQLDGLSFATHRELLDTLKTFGFKTAPFTPTCQTGSELWKEIEQLDSQRDDFEYEIDGAVIKIDDRSRYAELGGTAKFPHWATAYKYAPEQAETTLREITIQIGRTGVLTPVAELEPVQLAGTVVKRATLHNEDEIQRKDIRVGDRVIVEKAGEIIPAIVRALKDQRDGTEQVFEMPTTCPACGSDVERQDGEVAVRCINLQCPAQLKTWIKHFASRGALDIESIGGAVADKLVDTDLIRSPLDLYELKESDLAVLNLGTENDPRTFGAKHAAKVFQGLEKSKGRPLGKWLFALGIPKVGKICADHLASIYNNLEDIKSSELIPLRYELMKLLEYSQFIAPRNKSNNPIIPRTKRLEIDKQIKQLQASNSTPPEKISELEKLKAKYHSQESPEIARREELKKETKMKIEATKEKLKNGGIDCEALSGPAAKSIMSFMSSTQGNLLCQKTEKLRKPSAPSTTVSNSLEGFTFVLTGTLPSLKREEASDLIKLHGGKVSSSISGNTTYLLAGDSAGSKRAKAESLNVKVLSESELFELIGEEDPAEKNTPSGQQDWGF